VRVPGTGNPLVPQACQRTTPIFDGRMRYNLQFAYKRMEQVKTDKGYEGRWWFARLFRAGGRLYSAPLAIKYLASQRDMEVWLAPIGPTRVLVPYRISIPTPIGMGVMQATQFVSVALPRAAAAVRRRSTTSLAAGPRHPSYPQLIHRSEVAGIDSAAGARSRVLTTGRFWRPSAPLCYRCCGFASSQARCRRERNSTARSRRFGPVRSRLVPYVKCALSASHCDTQRRARR
jgi:hypothetical protein